MAVNEPIRRIVGANGDEPFEMWCSNNVSLCIVSKKKVEPLLDHKELQPLKKLGIPLQVLKNPAEPGYVEDTSMLNTPEWELAFTPYMRYKVQFEPVNAAICISHLRAIRQCLRASHNWSIIMEEDADSALCNRYNIGTAGDIRITIAKQFCSRLSSCYNIFLHVAACA